MPKDTESLAEDMPLDCVKVGRSFPHSPQVTTDLDLFRVTLVERVLHLLRLLVDNLILQIAVVYTQVLQGVNIGLVQMDLLVDMLVLEVASTFVVCSFHNFPVVEDIPVNSTLLALQQS